MKTKFKLKLLSILLVLVMVLALVPVSALTAFAAGGAEWVDFAINEHWGVSHQIGLQQMQISLLNSES